MNGWFIKNSGNFMGVGIVLCLLFSVSFTSEVRQDSLPRAVLAVGHLFAAVALTIALYHKKA